jgi:hypothetical protein
MALGISEYQGYGYTRGFCEGFLKGTGRGTKYLTLQKPVPLGGLPAGIVVLIVVLDEAISTVV